MPPRTLLLLALAALAAAPAAAEFTAADVRPMSEILAEYQAAPWKEEFMSLVQVEQAQGSLNPEGGDAAEGTEQKAAEDDVGACEVCTYVVESKQQHQPYLCRGLKDPDYQKWCVKVMESLMWWITNEVYWINYGCKRDISGATSWVRPCPAHAVCSWIEDLSTREPFCPADIKYKKPE